MHSSVGGQAIVLDADDPVVAQLRQLATDRFNGKLEEIGCKLKSNNLQASIGQRPGQLYAAQKNIGISVYSLSFAK